MLAGWRDVVSNIEHPTSNIERPTSKSAEEAKLKELNIERRSVEWMKGADGLEHRCEDQAECRTAVCRRSHPWKSDRRGRCQLAHSVTIGPIGRKGP
jgi:hypothetical protein